MYYSSGNYEAFATPKKPEGIEKKSAYIVGTGLGGLAAAIFLIRDAQMPGNHITLFEHLPLAGGSCDGIYDATKGFMMRGGREMDNHFECMWDLFRSVPSIVNPGETIFSEYYALNKEDPNFSLCRVTEKQGQDAHTDRKYALTPGAGMQLLKLFMTPNRDLEDVTIDDVFDDEFYSTNFWIYWQTMFAFEKWHSALEMKLYLQRYIHHIDGLPDLSALRFTRYNQYESMILPMCKYITDHGGKIEFDTTVTNVVCDCKPRQEGREEDRVHPERQAQDHRPHRERSGLHHQRLPGRLLRLRRSEHRPHRHHQERPEPLLRDVVQHCKAGRSLRPSRQVLQGYQGDLLGILDRGHRRQEDTQGHREDLQARSSPARSSPAA
jgi:myosin-crossreactive antigen